MIRLRFLVSLCCSWIVGLAGAADAAPPDAPAAQLVRNAIARHYVPRIAAFGAAANDLVLGIESLCKAPAEDTLRIARAKWTEAMLAWESANAVAFGPLLTRKSVYRIDFWPVRRYLIEQALKAPLAAAAGLDAVGGPAKGIPAIEWLLWEQAAGNPALLADPARCAYARLLAQGVASEARILNADFAALLASGLARPEDKVDEMFGLLLNQMLGALEQLGFRKMQVPASGNPRGFPRALSGETVAAWNAQWSSIRNLLIGENRGDSLIALLRARESAAAADRMQAAADRVTAALGAASRPTPDAAKRVAQELMVVRSVLQVDVAGALKIQIQFTDRDGLD